MADEAETDHAARLNIIDKKVFESRFVFIVGAITDSLARDSVKQLVALSKDSNDPIYVVVSSPGGHVESGDLVHDMVGFVPAPVTMIGSGWVASAGTHIFLSAPIERRMCLQNTRFLIHQPSGGIGGSGTDIEIQAKEIIKMRERIARIIARETGRELDSVLVDIERDYWMTADEAIEYGLVSRVIKHVSDLA